MNAATPISYSGQNLSKKDFSGQDLSHADFSECDLSHAWFDHAVLRHASFKGANLREVNFRNADLTGADLRGANLFGAVMEESVLDDVATDEDTKFFRLRCPEEGAFIGYKRCYDHRLVTLYIPADARRTSATMNSCRCDKAYVLSVTDFDYKEHYRDAISLIDENFVYTTHTMVYAGNFNPDRWRDSTGGIHFWMTKEEAFAY
ncbi:MAG: pentapeptide repeat-containing protein [Peptoniphilus sp.]|nr:pentapeptide repeat-containing protein [Peptoniphilus sp.]MDD7362603.1 pentapeptide repeat-containing protein [Bacillota bacterium]MDY6044998.1 pentapeptide repeat-containing protein [Peptoniphilus sp.]